MFTVEEIWEEQERQYNQLMQEDDQYCHPESFRWGFEHGFEYALSKFGWRPASEWPELDEKGNSKPVIAICGVPDPLNYGRCFPRFSAVVKGAWTDADVKLWCYPPKEE